MLIVKSGTVRYDGKDYGLGEILPGMEDSEKERLIKIGVCAETGEKTPPEKAQDAAPANDTGIKINAEDAIKHGVKK